jgi:hypothetical protein
MLQKLLQYMATDKALMGKLQSDPFLGPDIADLLGHLPSKPGGVVYVPLKQMPTPTAGGSYNTDTGVIQLSAGLFRNDYYGSAYEIMHELAHAAYFRVTGATQPSIYEEWLAYWYQTMAYQIIKSQAKQLGVESMPGLKDGKLEGFLTPDAHIDSSAILKYISSQPSYAKYPPFPPSFPNFPDIKPPGS